MSTTAEIKKKTFFDSKAFGACIIAYSIFGILLALHQMCSFEALLRPCMDYLIENKVITNDVSGPNFLMYYTYQSNIIVFIYMILFGLGLSGVKKLHGIVENSAFRGAVTLYIAVTGIVYCFILLPFSSSGYPWEPGVWLSNVVNCWMHMLTPALMIAFWFKTYDDNKLEKYKVSIIYLIYPISYFVISIIRGARTGFYPYPFLNSKQLWDVLLGKYDYNATIGGIMVIAVVILFISLYFALGVAMCTIHDKRIEKSHSEAA